MGLIFVKSQDGARHPSLFVWLLILTITLGAASFFLFGNQKTGLTTMTASQKKGSSQNKTSPIETQETDLAKSSQVDADTENAIKSQIELETKQGNGYLPESRKEEIRAKYAKEFNEKVNTSFRTNQKERLDSLSERQNLQKNSNASTGQPQSSDATGYMTFAERMGESNTKTTKGGSQSFDKEAGKKSDQLNKTAPSKTSSSSTELTPQTFSPLATKNFQNILPLGTFVPCILEGDIITSDLSNHVWATVALDVTFRRQLQLPKGLVRARGSTATQPVQDVVDVHFDTLIFSDGTELPISGYAYSALDPRYPNRFKTRGIPGYLIKPPLYLKLQALLYSAAIGASDAYVQNYINENTQQDESWTTVPVVNPTTGTITQQVQQTSSPPVNTNIGTTIGLTAAQNTMGELLDMAKQDLEKYKPYVTVEKGTPFYVQIDQTVDISERKINGVAIALALEAAQTKNSAQKQTVYAPGDARYKYNDQGGMPGISLQSQNALNAQTDSYLSKLQQFSGMTPNSPTNPANPSSSSNSPTNPNSQNLDQILNMLQNR